MLGQRRNGGTTLQQHRVNCFVFAAFAKETCLYYLGPIANAFMLFKCWVSVAGASPTFNQHWSVLIVLAGD